MNIFLNQFFSLKKPRYFAKNKFQNYTRVHFNGYTYVVHGKKMIVPKWWSKDVLLLAAEDFEKILICLYGPFVKSYRRIKSTSDQKLQTEFLTLRIAVPIIIGFLIIIIIKMTSNYIWYEVLRIDNSKLIGSTNPGYKMQKHQQKCNWSITVKLINMLN